MEQIALRRGRSMEFLYNWGEIITLPLIVVLEFDEFDFDFVGFGGLEFAVGDVYEV